MINNVNFVSDKTKLQSITNTGGVCVCFSRLPRHGSPTSRLTPTRSIFLTSLHRNLFTWLLQRRASVPSKKQKRCRILNRSRTMEAGEAWAPISVPQKWLAQHTNYRFWLICSYIQALNLHAIPCKFSSSWLWHRYRCSRLYIVA